MIEAADLREWRTHDVVDPTAHRLVFVPLDGVIVGTGYVKINYATSLVKNCPPTGTDDVLPATSEEAVFQHYGLQPLSHHRQAWTPLFTCSDDFTSPTGSA